MSKLLGLDIGEARTGLATGSTNHELVLPLEVLPTKELLASGSRLKRIIQDHEIELIIVGLPKSLSGEENAQARRTKNLAKKILALASWIDSEDVDIEREPLVVLVDERYTTKEAEARLLESGMSSRDMRSVADAMAAALILETYVMQTQLESSQELDTNLEKRD